MSRRSNLAHASVLFAGIALTLTACNGMDKAGTGPGTGGNTSPLSQAEAQAVSEDIRGELGGMSAGASLSGFMAPDLRVPVAAVYGGPRDFPMAPNCPALSQNPPTDADGDHVPDDLTITYDPANCTFASPTGHAVFTLSGTIHILDPSQTDPAIRVEFGNFQSKFAIDDTLFWLRRVAGPWQLLTSSAGFSATDSTTVTAARMVFGIGAMDHSGADSMSPVMRAVT